MELQILHGLGGEALLYPNIDKLMKIAKENGIKNKLITNGLLLAQNQEKREILDYLDSLTLSLDTINNDTNEELGRGRTHFEDVKVILDYVKDKNIKINVNTVVSKKNIKEIKQLGEFLNNYNINKWKFFKFMPLREAAEKNKEEFEITDAEFEQIKNVYRHFGNIEQTDFRQEKDMEEKYTLLTANGDIIKTENGIDIKKGNALYQNPVDFMNTEKNKVRKIKTLIAHNNIDVTNNILETIDNLDYVEVVGTASNGKETYNKIINLKPDIVFSEYNMEELNGLDIIKLSKEKLDQNVPVFNFITDRNIKDEELKEAIHIIGKKMNSFITDPINDSILYRLEEYKNA